MRWLRIVAPALTQPPPSLPLPAQGEGPGRALGLLRIARCDRAPASWPHARCRRLPSRFQQPPRRTRPPSGRAGGGTGGRRRAAVAGDDPDPAADPAPLARSEEHTSELQSLMRISYAVFCLKKKKTNIHHQHTHQIKKIT